MRRGGQEPRREVYKKNTSLPPTDGHPMCLRLLHTYLHQNEDEQNNFISVAPMDPTGNMAAPSIKNDPSVQWEATLHRRGGVCAQKADSFHEHEANEDCWRAAG